jgi:hypothetical protein
MGPYFLWAAPGGITEGTLALLLVLVSSMPSKFLGSPVPFAAISAVMLLPGSLVVVLGILRGSWFLVLLNITEN